MRHLQSIIITGGALLILLHSGCGGGGSSAVLPTTASGTNYAATPDAALFGATPTAIFDLTPAALNEINAGATTEVTTGGGMDFGAYLPPDAPFVPGSDYTSRVAPDISPIDGSAPDKVTLLPGQNRVTARIANHSGTPYPEWADFYVPDGYIAQDFRVQALAGGRSTLGSACVPGFAIYDNMGVQKYAYIAAHTVHGTSYASSHYPASLAQIRLTPLTRQGQARPYRLFCAGGNDAMVRIQCNVVPANDDPDGNITLGSGAFQVTLTWDTNETDIDLHVIEPDGDHVFYDNTASPSAELDRDDTDGFGPENYYVLTDATPEVGAYQIYLDYYSGADDGTVPATNCLVRIKTTAGTQVYTVRLTAEDEARNVAQVTFNASGQATIDGSMAGTPRPITRSRIEKK